MEDCIPGRVYELRCRNLAFGVYDGAGGFIGIRTKFGSRFLDTEFHWDKSKHFGTVCSIKDTEINIPEGMELKIRLGTIDAITERPVDFDEPITKGGRGWFFTDTNEASTEIQACGLGNPELFKFLDGINS